MKELKNIVGAYDAAITEGKKTALATVVHVEGSSYRRPGARMLVTDDGVLTGAISGGCLEGDALRKALLAIQQNKNKLVTYDTTDDDTALGVQLGCNGIVHILFEPLDSTTANAIDLLRTSISNRTASVVVTLFSLIDRELQPGTILSTGKQLPGTNTSLPEAAIERLKADMLSALENRCSELKEYEVQGATISAFIQVITPPISLVIFGAGNDAIPLANLAHQIGWNVTVVDGRQSHATKQRFAVADKIVIAKSDAATAELTIDNTTAAVLMTHNYNYDLRVLQSLLGSACPYIGTLGPAKKLQKMYDDLEQMGINISAEDSARIFGPVGLDIAAETAEEIALSITAEIKAVLSQTVPASLRQKEGPIHSRIEQPSYPVK